MGFFDLNIPYHESDRHASDKSSLKGRRLKLALKAMELGYTGIAYNRTLKGVMSESDRCSTPLFPISKLTSSSSSPFFATVKYHRELLNVAVSSPFRQYTRLTVIVDVPSQASALNAGNPILRGYDIVAVRPMNQNAFDQACQTSEVDIIAIDFAEKLPFRLKQPMIKAAIKRGVYFEITYSGFLADAQSKRQMISNCKLLVDWTRGKNLIFSSAAPFASELRGPQDVTNLFSLLGLPIERAKAAISKNCRTLLANALRRKHFYKEAVKVEEIIPSGGQMNPKQSTFNEWLKWDPISSGEGDLLLDDMEKAFATSNTVAEPVRTINFTSSMNGLPAHGLQIKDLIGVTKAALEPAAMEIEEAVAVENSEQHEGQSSVLENQGILATLSKEQTSSSCFTNMCQESNVSLDYVLTGPDPLAPLPKEVQASLNDAKMIAMSSLPSCNSEETVSLSSKKLNYSNDSEAKLVASEAILQDTPCQDALPDGERVHSTFDNDVSVQLSNPLNECSSSALQFQQSNDASVPAQEGAPVDKVLNKIDSESKQGLSLVLFDVSSQKVSVEEKYGEMSYSSVKSIEGHEPISDDVRREPKQIDYQGRGKSQAGRVRRKRNLPRQPFLSPLKSFLNPRPFKRKSRK